MSSSSGKEMSSSLGEKQEEVFIKRRSDQKFHFQKSLFLPRGPYQGRPGALEALKEGLQSHGEQILCGPLGVGKTWLAVAYLFGLWNKSEYPGGPIFFLHLNGQENSSSNWGAFLETVFRSPLNLPDSIRNSVREDSVSSRNKINEELGRYPNALFVVDNLQDLEDFKKYRELFNGTSHHRIYTCVIPEILSSHELGNIIYKVKNFDLEMAKNFVRHPKPQQRVAQSKIVAIVEHFNRMPHALARIRDSQNDRKKMGKLYDDISNPEASVRETGIRERPASKVMLHKLTTYDSYEEILRKYLISLPTSKRYLIYKCAFLSEKGFSRSVLRELDKDSTVDVDEIILILKKVILVKKQEADKIQFPPIVRKIIVDICFTDLQDLSIITKYSSKVYCIEFFLNIIKFISSDFFNESWLIKNPIEQYVRYIDHAQSIVDIFLPNISEELTPGNAYIALHLSKILFNISYIYYLSSEYESSESKITIAITWYDRVKKYCNEEKTRFIKSKNITPGGFALIDSMLRLITISQELKFKHMLVKNQFRLAKYSEAEKTCVDYINSCHRRRTTTRSNVENKKAYAIYLSSLASIYIKKAEKWDEAESHIRESLQIKSTLIEVSTQLLTTEEIFKKAEEMKGKLSPEYVEYAITLRIYGNWYYAQGLYSRALAKYEQSCCLLVGFYNSEQHPFVLTVKRLIASTQRLLGAYEEAWTSQIKILNQYVELHYPETHPHYLAAELEIAKIYYLTSNFTSAVRVLDNLDEKLGDKEKKRIPDIPYYRGRISIERGNYSQARTYLFTALEWCQDLNFSRDMLDSGASPSSHVAVEQGFLSNFSFSYERKIAYSPFKIISQIMCSFYYEGEYEKAKLFYVEGHKIISQFPKLPERYDIHPLAFMHQLGMAKILYREGDYSGAKKIIKEMETSVESYFQDAPRTMTHRNIADIERLRGQLKMRRGNYGKARILFDGTKVTLEDCYAARETECESHGECKASPASSSSGSQVMFSYSLFPRPNMSLKNASYFFSLYDLASIKIYYGEYEDASDLLRRSISGLNQLYLAGTIDTLNVPGFETPICVHPYLIRHLTCLARLWTYQSYFDEAIFLLRTLANGQFIQEKKMTKYTLARINYYLGEAIYIYRRGPLIDIEKCYTTAIDKYSSDHPQSVFIYLALARLYIYYRIDEKRMEAIKNAERLITSVFNGQFFSELASPTLSFSGSPSLVRVSLPSSSSPLLLRTPELKETPDREKRQVAKRKANPRRFSPRVELNIVMAIYESSNGEYEAQESAYHRDLTSIETDQKLLGFYFNKLEFHIKYGDILQGKGFFIQFLHDYYHEKVIERGKKDNKEQCNTCIVKVVNNQYGYLLQSRYEEDSTKRCNSKFCPSVNRVLHALSFLIYSHPIDVADSLVALRIAIMEAEILNHMYREEYSILSEKSITKELIKEELEYGITLLIKNRLLLAACYYQTGNDDLANYFYYSLYYLAMELSKLSKPSYQISELSYQTLYQCGLYFESEYFLSKNPNLLLLAFSVFFSAARVLAETKQAGFFQPCSLDFLSICVHIVRVKILELLYHKTNKSQWLDWLGYFNKSPWRARGTDILKKKSETALTKIDYLLALSCFVESIIKYCEPHSQPQSQERKQYNRWVSLACSDIAYAYFKLERYKKAKRLLNEICNNYEAGPISDVQDCLARMHTYIGLYHIEASLTKNQKGFKASVGRHYYLQQAKILSERADSLKSEEVFMSWKDCLDGMDVTVLGTLISERFYVNVTPLSLDTKKKEINRFYRNYFEFSLCKLITIAEGSLEEAIQSESQHSQTALIVRNPTQNQESEELADLLRGYGFVCEHYPALDKTDDLSKVAFIILFNNALDIVNKLLIILDKIKNGPVLDKYCYVIDNEIGSCRKLCEAVSELNNFSIERAFIFFKTVNELKGEFEKEGAALTIPLSTNQQSTNSSYAGTSAPSASDDNLPGNYLVSRSLSFFTPSPSSSSPNTMLPEEKNPSKLQIYDDNTMTKESLSAIVRIFKENKVEFEIEIELKNRLGGGDENIENTDTFTRVSQLSPTSPHPSSSFSLSI